MRRIKLDKIDRKILKDLQADGRITNVELAKRAGISAPPCLRRVRSLEEAGFIRGYHARIEPQSMGYGITVFAPPAEMVSALPPSHFKFYTELESILRIGDFICVHAGLNPLRDLTAQNDSDVFWIRDEFLNSVHPFRHTVVFGHTPHRDVFQHLPYKVGIDTGLVFGNKLTCLELYSGQLFQLGRDKTEVTVSQVDVSKRVFPAT